MDGGREEEREGEKLVDSGCHSLLDVNAQEAE